MQSLRGLNFIVISYIKKYCKRKNGKHFMDKHCDTYIGNIYLRMIFFMYIPRYIFNMKKRYILFFT